MIEYKQRATMIGYKQRQTNRTASDEEGGAIPYPRDGHALEARGWKG